MSGPKSFSIEIFNDKIIEIFRKQSQIDLLLKEISGLQCSDNERGIQFDCDEFISTNLSLIENLLQTYALEFKGTFRQEIYNHFNNQITQKLDGLNLFIKKIENEKQNFLSKETDYQAYLTYEKYFRQSIESFNDLKSRVINYLESYLKNDYQEFFIEAKKEIDKIKIDVEMKIFNYGFNNELDTYKKMIMQAIDQSESAINVIRKNISEKVSHIAFSQEYSNLSQIDLLKLSDINKNDREMKNKIQQINEIILSVEDSIRKEKYKLELFKLTHSDTFKDVYFYTELLEDIKNSEKNHFYKVELQKFIVEINSINIHKKLHSLKKQLIQKGLAIIEKERIKSYELDDFQSKLNQLKNENIKCYQDELIKEKEKEFLKAQLIKSLENLNYEVMTDMEVIDFEKESDFILKIPDQSNYLNLRFEQDGSFLYNFLIPENKLELSIDRKQQKLNEMNSTCKEFKNLLLELSSYGLKIDLKKESAVSEKALIQVPEKHRQKLKVKSKVKKKEIDKRKSLKR